MKNFALWIVAATVLVIVSYGPAASAGLKEDAGPRLYVFVDLTAGSKNAFGSMGAARSSGDLNQYIGCDLNADATGQWVYCYARDASGVPISCLTRIPALVEAAKGIASASFVAFGVNDPSPGDPLGVTCDSVVTFNNSSFPPKP